MAGGANSVIKYKVGTPGSGKSCTSAIWILEEFLLHKKGKLFTNLPLNIDKIVWHMAKKGFDEDQIRGRIILFDLETCQKWKDIDPKTKMPPVNSAWLDLVQEDKDRLKDEEDYEHKVYQHLGPWEYFQHVSEDDMSGAHIIFDEIQKFVHTRSSLALKTVWGDWLSTIRHLGCTIEFMTQRDDRVPKEIKDIAQFKLELLPNSAEKFPWLPIYNYDYYQLGKKFLGINFTSTTMVEWGVAEGGKKKVVARKKYRFDPYYFQFYDSYNNEETGKSGNRELEESEKLSHIGLLWWFFKRNFFPVVLLGVYLFVGWYVSVKQAGWV